MEEINMQKTRNIDKTLMQNMLKREIEEKLRQSEEDYLNGRVRDMEDVFKEWEEKYGI